MRSLRCTLLVTLIVISQGHLVAQEPERVTTLSGFWDYLAELEHPDTLSLQVSGIFRSPDFQSYALLTVDPFVDPGAAGQWCLIKGERYDYELALTAGADDGRIRSLAMSVAGQLERRSEPDAPAGQASIGGSFIAEFSGLMLPAYSAVGEAELEVTVGLSTLPLPNPADFNPVFVNDPRLKLARLDVGEFVTDCERLGGHAVIEVTAPAESTVHLWTIGHPEGAVTLPVGEKVGSRALPPTPWNLRIELPEGMTVADLPDGRVNLQLDAEGIFPEWPGRAGED